MGMRQRLELASALVGDPDVLILDEPSNGLDPQGIAWLRDLMRYLAGEGRTILVSSHLLAEMAQTIDNAVIVSHGKLRAQGTLESITSGVAEASMHARTPEADRLCAVLTEAEGPVPPTLPGPGRHRRHDARTTRTAPGQQPDRALRADQSGCRPRSDLPLPHVGTRLRGHGDASMINAVRSELLKMRTMPGIWVCFGLAFPLTALIVWAVFASAGGSPGHTYSFVQTLNDRRELLGADISGSPFWPPFWASSASPANTATRR